MSRQLIGLCAVGLLTSLTMSSSLAEQDARREPRTSVQPQLELTFRAGDLLPRRALRGPNYAIDEKVRLVDGHYLFTMHTSYGDLAILGRNLLDQRVHEMHAVERLRKIGMEPQIVAGALETVRNTPRGLGELLRDPAGTILRAPRSVRRIVRGTLDPAQRRAGSRTRRQLALQLDCDPETTNPILSSQLDSVADRRELGKILSKVGMSVAVPGLGLVPTTAEMKDLIATATPEQINAQVQERLETLGIDERLAKRFVAQPHYTTMQRLQFTSSMETLRDVEHLDVLVRAAVATDNETKALDMLQTARLLGELHGTKPIASIHNSGFLLAVLKGGMHLFLVSDDYLTNRPELAEAVAAYRREYPEAKTLLYSAGRLSPEARKTFQSAKVQILESGTVAALVAALEGPQREAN